MKIEKTAKCKPTRYPWEKWFKKQVFKVRRGVDYNCMTYSMMMQIRNYASSVNTSVHLSAKDDVITVTKVQ